MKTKRGIRGSAWKFLAGLILTPLSCLLLCSASAMIYWNEGYVQRSLPTQLLPTAQALLEHPLPTPEYLRVSPSEGICVRVNRNKMPFASSAMLTRFIINGVPVPNKSHMMMNLSPEDYCLYNLDLPFGLHLIAIEFRLFPSQLPFSHQWAMDIK